MDEKNLHLRTDDDVEAILRLAISRQGSDTRELRQRLEESANELGITQEQLIAAEEEYKLQKAQEVERENARRVELERRRRQVKGLVAHWVPFLLANALLHYINFTFTKGSYWAIWPLFGWGIGMVSHTWAVLTNQLDEEEADELSRRAKLEINLRRRGYDYTDDGHEIRVSVRRGRQDR